MTDRSFRESLGLEHPPNRCPTALSTTASREAGVAYIAFNLNEYFLEWTSAPEIGLSLVWLLAGDFFWGVIKAASTLALGNAWMHIFTTYTFHLGDAPTVAQMFRVR